MRLSAFQKFRIVANAFSTGSLLVLGIVAMAIGTSPAWFFVGALMTSALLAIELSKI